MANSKIIPTEEDFEKAWSLTLEAFAEVYQGIVDLTPEEEIIKGHLEGFAENLLNQDDRSFCILTLSFIEDCLKEIFKHSYRITNKALEGEYFGSNGPLSTLSQRILIARGAGWIDENSQKELNTIRKIRNQFAHDFKVSSLLNEPVLSWANSIAPKERAWVSREEFANQLDKADLRTKLRMRIFFSAMMITSKAIARAKKVEFGLPSDYAPSQSVDDILQIERYFVSQVIIFCFESIGYKNSGS